MGDEATDPSGGDEVARIVDAAWQVLRGSGYENVKIQAVIRRSGVSVGSFYRHFSSKEELLRAMLEQELRRATAILDNLTAAGTPEDRVRAWVDAIVSLAYGRHAGPRARWFTTVGGRVNLDPSGGTDRAPDVDTNRPLREAIEAGRADGTFPAAEPVTDAALINALCSRLDEMGVRWLGDDRTVAVELVGDFVVAALTNPAPRRRGPASS